MSQTNDSDLVGTAVVERDGRRGRIVASPAAASSAEDDSAVLIEVAHGRTVLIGRGRGLSGRVLAAQGVVDP